MSLAVQQKKVIDSLTAKFPTENIAGIIRSVAEDLDPGDYRAAIIDEAARRLDMADRVFSLSLLGADLSEQSDEDRRRDAALNDVPDFDGTMFVKCPVEGCGQEMVHPQRILVNSGGHVTTISRRGARHFEASPVGGGVLIAIEFQCEAGHVLHQKMNFSHGTTWTCVEHVETLDPESSVPDVIWRA